ncbi:MAG: PilX N-terminal domain-containing pilus assembly protein [Rhodanobacteraceae bacterium]|nr:PilX N-terminal domain-containing pilus assembly protein [Pseudomonadota bacterium]
MSRQRGIALFIGLVFLVVLSLVAVIAMQSTLLEMRMVTNVARQAEAFQISDSGRAVLTGPTGTSLFAQSLELGGWPVSWGGDVPDADFDMSVAAGIGCTGSAPWSLGDCPATVVNFVNALTTAHGTPLKLLYGALDNPGADGVNPEDPANPSTWLTDAIMTFTDPNNPSGTISATLSVVPDGIGANAGAGAAQAAGYRGLGVALASGGAARYFQIKSAGLSPADATNGRAVTIAQYKAIVQ